MDRVRYREQRNILNGDMNILIDRGMRLDILTMAKRRRRVILRYIGIKVTEESAAPHFQDRSLSSLRKSVPA